MGLYTDPVLEKIITVIDASDGGEIKKFFYGDPIFIAKSDLPCLIASKDTTEIGDASNAEDYHRMAVVLTLVIDIRKFFDETPKNIHVGFQKLYDMMEGRESDYTLKNTSIVDILRKNHNLTNNANIDLETPMMVDYGFSVGRRGEGVWAQEANLSFNVYFTQLRD